MFLKSMLDFILNENIEDTADKDAAEIYKNYALFLKQPLKLGMFVPCDEDGNVLESPYLDNVFHSHYRLPVKFSNVTDDYVKKYEKAKEKVLFIGWIYTGGNSVKCGMFQYNFDRHEYQDIESLLNFKQAVKYLELTESAIKQIGLI